jgi:hypothetical protein
MTNLIFLIIGLFNFFVHKSFAKGDVVYLVFMAALILLLLWMTAGTQRSDNLKYAHDFRLFLSGIIIIMGIAALMIPLLVNKKWFEDFFL